MNNTHDLVWFHGWLRERVADMAPRERTLNLKLGRASAKQLLASMDAQVPAAEKPKEVQCPTE